MHPGEQIKTVRNRLRLTQTEMATLLGVSKSMVSQMEHAEAKQGQDASPRSDREAAAHATASSLMRLIQEAEGGIEQSIETLNRMYEKLGSNLRWVHGSGPSAINSAFGFLLGTAGAPMTTLAALGGGAAALGASAGAAAGIVGAAAISGLGAVAGLASGSTAASSAPENAQTEIDHVNRTWELFNRLDKDHNNTIDFEELAEALGWPNEEEARALFNILDVNRNNVLSFGEFLRAPLPKPLWTIIGTAKGLTEALSR